MIALTDRLLEAIAERQRLAEACIDEVGSHHAGDTYADGSGIAEYDAYPSYPWGSGDAELAYMAATDPATVLRECAAHRRIVHRYLDAVLEATTANQVGTPALYAERRVAVLADVLDDLATAYGITR